MKYMGRVILGFSEAEFWRTTPIELDTFVKKYIEINDNKGKKSNKEKKYIDEIF